VGEVDGQPEDNMEGKKLSEHQDLLSPIKPNETQRQELTANGSIPKAVYGLIIKTRRMSMCCSSFHDLLPL